MELNIGVNEGVAVLLTLGITQIIKDILNEWVEDGVSKFIPIITVISAFAAVLLLVDLSSVGAQDIILMGVFVAGSAIGAFSGTKNVAQGIARQARPPD